MPQRHRGSLVCQGVAAWAGAWLLVGCSARVGGDGRSLSAHNDELRRDNAELRQQIDATQEKLARLESELRVYREDHDPALAIAGAVLPVFTGLEFGRYTGPIDTDGDGIDDELRLYVKPVDQLGRTLVVPGRAEVKVLDLTGDEPNVLTEQTWEPGEWDTAYRSGFTGDHYALVMPLPNEAGSDVREITVRVAFTEASRGTQRDLQAVYPLSR